MILIFIELPFLQQKNIFKLTSRMIIYKLPIKVQGEFCKCRNWFSDVFCVTCFTTHIQASARHKLCRLPLSLSSLLQSSLFLPQNSIDMKSIDWEGFHFFAVVKSLADSLVFEPRTLSVWSVEYPCKTLSLEIFILIPLFELVIIWLVLE